MISSNRFRKTHTVQRYTGSHVKGRWTIAADGEPFTILASRQPLKSHEWNALVNEVQGTKFREAYRLYTNTDLITTADGEPDRVQIDGSEFEVYKRDNWGNNLIDHNKYIVIKRDRV